MKLSVMSPRQVRRRMGLYAFMWTVEWHVMRYRSRRFSSIDAVSMVVATALCT